MLLIVIIRLYKMTVSPLHCTGHLSEPVMNRANCDKGIIEMRLSVMIVVVIVNYLFNYLLHVFISPVDIVHPELFF